MKCCCLFRKIHITNSFFLATTISVLSFWLIRKLQYVNRFENYTHRKRRYISFWVWYLQVDNLQKWWNIMIPHCNNVHSTFVFNNLRFTTAPTQSVICDRKCRISKVGKVLETVVNRKDSRTTYFTTYNLFWNGGLETNSCLTFRKLKHFRVIPLLS